MKERIRI